MNRLAHNVNINQVHQEGVEVMIRDAARINTFVQGLINDHGTYKADGFGLKLSEIPFEVQKTFLNILASESDEHRWALHYTYSDTKAGAAITECTEVMQHLIDINLPVIRAQIQNEIDRHIDDQHMIDGGLTYRNHWMEDAWLTCAHGY